MLELRSPVCLIGQNQRQLWNSLKTNQREDRNLTACFCKDTDVFFIWCPLYREHQLHVASGISSPSFALRIITQTHTSSPFWSILNIKLSIWQCWIWETFVFWLSVLAVFQELALSPEKRGGSSSLFFFPALSHWGLPSSSFKKAPQNALCIRT